MQVKAQGLLNAAKWIEDQYGRTTLQEIVRACSPAVRERYVSAIAINWHPMEELMEFVEVAEKALGRGDGKIADQIGAAGARANMKGVVIRFAFYVAKPEYLMKRVAGLWRQFNDEGEMGIVHIDQELVVYEVSGMSTPHTLFCAMITGWGREVAGAVGVINPQARHVECRTRGQTRCVWEVRGHRINPSEPPPK